jgi:hypothetical protein
MVTRTVNRLPEALPLEQLRDLYERIPFVRGRTRVALLHRLRRVSIELREARASARETPISGSRAAGTARERTDTCRR